MTADPEPRALIEWLDGLSRRTYTRNRPTGDGWYSLAEIASDRSVLESWQHLSMNGPMNGHPAVAAAGLAGQLSAWLSEVTVVPLVLRGVSLVIDPGAVALHSTPRGSVDAVTLGAPRVVEAHELEEVADGIVATLEPLFMARPNQGRFGRKAAWGMLADAMTEQATRHAHRLGLDANAEATTAERLIEVVAKVADVHIGARFTSVDVDGEQITAALRRTCCLYYQVRHPNRSAAGEYCSTCPLISDAERASPLLEELLQERERGRA